MKDDIINSKCDDSGIRKYFGFAGAKACIYTYFIMQKRIDAVLKNRCDIIVTLMNYYILTSVNSQCFPAGDNIERGLYVSFMGKDF